MMKERILPLSLPKGRRIIAISDIHGNLPYLEGLLDKLRFGEDDILFILGDFTEKGPRSLDTLRYIMALSEKYTVHTLSPLLQCRTLRRVMLDCNTENRDFAPTDFTHLEHFLYRVDRKRNR